MYYNLLAGAAAALSWLVTIHSSLVLFELCSVRFFRLLQRATVAYMNLR